MTENFTSEGKKKSESKNVPSSYTESGPMLGPKEYNEKKKKNSTVVNACNPSTRKTECWKRILRPPVRN
jgi:hypothetical protein